MSDQLDPKITGNTDDFEQSPLASSEYISVQVQEFLTGSEASTDIYLKLSDTLFKKVAHVGMLMPIDQISRYQKSGVSHLYIKREHFSHYVGFSLRIANIAKDSQEIAPERKVALAHLLTSNLINQTCFHGINKSQLQDAFETVDTLITTLSKNTQITDLLSMMSREDGQPAHALAVAAISNLIAKELGWDRQATLAKVVLGGLFHDIGEKELPADLLLQKRIDLDASSLRLIETHTTRGRDLLLSIKQMPEDVALIASQHHERMNGTGYPCGLKKEQIHPLARLVAVADTFCELVSGESTGEQMTPTTAIEKMQRVNCLDFDQTFVSALSRLLCQNTTQHSIAGRS